MEVAASDGVAFASITALATVYPVGGVDGVNLSAEASAAAVVVGTAADAAFLGGVAGSSSLWSAGVLDGLALGGVLSGTLDALDNYLTAVLAVTVVLRVDTLTGSSDQIALGDTAFASVATRAVLQDAFRLTTAVSFGSTWVAEIADALDFSDTLTVTVELANAVEASLSEVMQIVSTSSALHGRLAEALGSFGVGDFPGVLSVKIVRETVRVEDAMNAPGTYRITTGALARFSAFMTAGRPVALADSATVGEELKSDRVLRVIERMGIASSLAVALHGNIAVAETARMLASLGQFVGADLSDIIGAVDIAVARGAATATVSDQVEVSGAPTEKLLIRADLTEGADFEASDVLRMIYAPEVSETLELSLGYVAPDGSITTWAMNTRTGAVTEFANYAFNSFATFGTTVYGATSDGLYELSGDTDAASPIVARLRSGYLQFGGTQLSRLKEAYIAARGGGDYVLKILTGDGEEYVYSVNSRSMRSTKVHMGKGQRARYFAFELESSGQDFDLDTLEFVPIVVQRRV